VNTQALEGRRVLVTRGARQSQKLSDGLRSLGAVPVEVPVIEIQPPASYEPLDEALSRLSSYDWLILTSSNTVRVLLERASHLGIDLAQARHLSVAAVGPGTAAEAGRANLLVRWIPETYVAEGLVAGLRDQMRRDGMEKVEMGPRRVLLARAAIARDVIPDALRKAGAEVDVVDAYRNVLPDAAPGELRQAVARGLDAATFTSSSSATHLEGAALLAGVRFPLDGVRAVSIGPVTSRTLFELGWEPEAEAASHDIPGLIEAVVRAFANRAD
jgi:uroporphyrinogen-III synthase